MEDQIKRMIPLVAGAGQEPSDRTDEKGAFRIRRLPEGKFLVSATHPDFAPASETEAILPLDGRAADLRLRLRAPSSLRIVVREGEKPRPGLMVQVLGEGPMKMVSTDPQGAAEFGNLAPGTYMIQILELAKMMAGQGLGLKQRSVTVEEGRALEEEFVFGKGAKVSGKVIGELPKPMAMVVISRTEGPKTEDTDFSDFKKMIAASQFNVGTAMVDPDGTFTVPDIPDGEYILEIPRMPSDYTKWAGMSREEKVPYHRAPIKVTGGKDLKLPDIRIGR